MSSLQEQVPEMNYQSILESAWQNHLAPRRENAPTVVSLFAGCGGSSLGYSMAGYRELLAVEWNAKAAACFRLNFPGVPVFEGDISKLLGDQALNLAGIKPRELDVLDGSPPCQGFSTAGKRVFEDPRNSLLREYVRLLETFQPKAFVMENVSGMVKGKMSLIFVDILKALKECGYQVTARLMNAMYFNVPQSRSRIIFIGGRDRSFSHPAASSHPINLRSAIEWVEECSPVNGSCSPLQKQRWAQTRKGNAHHERFSLLRLDWEKPVPTILRTTGSGGHMHPDIPRLLTVEEHKACASFPSKFKMPNRWHDAIDQIGNCVPPLFMKEIAVHLRSQLEAQSA